MAAPVYLADTSVLVWQGRDAHVFERFERLALDGRLAVCQMTALEFLDNAPDPAAYTTVRASLHAHRWLDVDQSSMDRALEIHGLLAATSQHRNFSLPDLIVAATAEMHGATVLHYDRDFDRIAEVTGQPVEWVATPGSL